MDDRPKNVDTLIWFLSERAKELNCLYKIEELLNKTDTNLDDICKGVIEAIPPGWQYPDICIAKITLEGHSCQSPNFKETPWIQFADIQVQDKKVGRLSVYYTAEMPNVDDGPFLKEETKLLKTIVERLGHYLLYSRMKHAYQDYQTARKDVVARRADEWRVAMNFLRQTNKNLFLNISRRMLNFLSWSGVQDAERMLQKSLAGTKTRQESQPEDDNRPFQRTMSAFSEKMSGGQASDKRPDLGQHSEVDSRRPIELSRQGDQPEPIPGEGRRCHPEVPSHRRRRDRAAAGKQTWRTGLTRPSFSLGSARVHSYRHRAYRYRRFLRDP
jgi:hypothetical protein